jgi:hypothetical protein
MNSDLISKAVGRRFTELCSERVRNLAPPSFGEMSPFVSSVRQQLLDTSPGSLKSSSSSLTIPADWMEVDSDCLESLRRLSLGEPLPHQTGAPAPGSAFLQELKTTGKEPRRSFQLLAARYACPLNFALPAEDDVREYVLMRLMVHDRVQVEKASIGAVESDNLLLNLNLVAIHAAAAHDLRFLDALNYYYELMPATWRPNSRHGWLLASYFALYSRALTVWL